MKFTKTRQSSIKFGADFKTATKANLQCTKSFGCMVGNFLKEIGINAGVEVKEAWKFVTRKGEKPVSEGDKEVDCEVELETDLFDTTPFETPFETTNDVEDCVSTPNSTTNVTVGKETESAPEEDSLTHARVETPDLTLSVQSSESDISVIDSKRYNEKDFAESKV